MCVHVYICIGRHYYLTVVFVGYIFLIFLFHSFFFQFSTCNLQPANLALNNSLLLLHSECELK